MAAMLIEPVIEQGDATRPDGVNSLCSIKPLIVTFTDLCDALAVLHLHEKRWVDALHDIWKQGAPSPDSRVLVATGYDPRLRQVGAVEKRIVFPTPLASWMQQVATAHGMALSPRQAFNILDGHADYGLEAHR